MSLRALVVDDDLSTREMLVLTLGRQNVAAESASGAEDALGRLRQATFDVVITDLEMPGMTGIELARRVAEGPGVPVIVLTGRADVDRAIAAIRAGVADFLTKPVSIDDLVVAIERAVRHHTLSTEIQRLRTEVLGEHASADMLGQSRAVRELQDLLTRVAPSDVPVLVTGESGVGKELVARALHDRSLRREGPFVAINCAALPATLLESELFGHVKGAFTDAQQDKRGLFLEASGGTLFLDEVGELPLEVQAKLLRALQERRVRPVGGGLEQSYDARVISATNRDLEESVEDGRFREDLFYRINVVHLAVPPLRARGRDVLLLAEAFVQRAAERSRRPVRGVAESAARKLLAYDWPGNVRELENCIERGVALTRFDEITAEDLPEKVRSFEASTGDEQALEAELPSMEELERRHIVRVLEAVKGNKTRAAQVLGFDRRTLYRKAERYGLRL
ncbi:MAG: sigma-54 dependent transcriptional regulator [Myxococcota bacterium]